MKTQKGKKIYKKYSLKDTSLFGKELKKGDMMFEVIKSFEKQNKRRDKATDDVLRAVAAEVGEL